MRIVERAAVIGVYLVPSPDRELRVGTLLRDKTGMVSRLWTTAISPWDRGGR